MSTLPLLPGQVLPLSLTDAGINHPPDFTQFLRMHPRSSFRHQDPREKRWENPSHSSLLLSQLQSPWRMFSIKPPDSHFPLQEPFFLPLRVFSSQLWVPFMKCKSKTKPNQTLLEPLCALSSALSLLSSTFCFPKESLLRVLGSGEYES